MSCNCNNGKTFIDFLTTVPGGTADNSTYLLALTHYTCGNRKLCVNDAYPVTAQLTFTPLGTPRSVGNGTYCCDVLCTGTVTYMPYKYGCNCNTCPQTDNIYTTLCVPCASATTPSITAGTCQCSPTNVQPCCSVTNAVAINTSFAVAEAEAENTAAATAKRKA